MAKRSSRSKKNMPARWQDEDKAARAVQVAFDLDERVQTVIRREAIDRGLNPSDRVREILGLHVSRKPVRLRLSVSLAEADFVSLAEAFGLDPDNRIGIKQEATTRLIAHADKQRAEDQQ